MPHPMIESADRRAWDLMWANRAYERACDHRDRLRAEEENRYVVVHPLALSNMPLTRYVWIRAQRFATCYVYEMTDTRVRYSIDRVWSSKGYGWQGSACLTIGDLAHEISTPECDTFGQAELRILIHVRRILAGERLGCLIENHQMGA